MHSNHNMNVITFVVLYSYYKLCHNKKKIYDYFYIIIDILYIHESVNLLMYGKKKDMNFIMKMYELCMSS